MSLLKDSRLRQMLVQEVKKALPVEQLPSNSKGGEGLRKFFFWSVGPVTDLQTCAGSWVWVAQVQVQVYHDVPIQNPHLAPQIWWVFPGTNVMVTSHPPPLPPPHNHRPMHVWCHHDHVFCITSLYITSDHGITYDMCMSLYNSIILPRDIVQHHNIILWLLPYHDECLTPQ